MLRLGWFYKTKAGSVVRIGWSAPETFLALIVSGQDRDPWGFHLVTSDGRDLENLRDPNPLLILESGSWLHDLTAAWKAGDGILVERLKEAGRKVVG